MIHPVWRTLAACRIDIFVDVWREFALSPGNVDTLENTLAPTSARSLTVAPPCRVHTYVRTCSPTRRRDRQGARWSEVVNLYCFPRCPCAPAHPNTNVD